MQLIFIVLNDLVYEGTTLMEEVGVDLHHTEREREEERRLEVNCLAEERD